MPEDLAEPDAPTSSAPDRATTRVLVFEIPVSEWGAPWSHRQTPATDSDVPRALIGRAWRPR
jgi:hypothetical protein